MMKLLPVDQVGVQAELRFMCQNCSAPGFQIFLPNTTAGFKMWLSEELFGAPGQLLAVRLFV